MQNVLFYTLILSVLARKGIFCIERLQIENTVQFLGQLLLLSKKFMAEVTTSPVCSILFFCRPQLKLSQA